MRRFALALLIASPLVVTTACGDRDRDTVGSTEKNAMDASEIAKRPDAFYGKPVTVTSEVETVHGPNAFTLDEDAAFAGPDVLVIVPKGAKPMEADQDVLVHGTVRRLVVADLERDYDWFDAKAYDGDLLIRFKERPVIIADLVQATDDGGVVAGAGSPPRAVAPEPGREDPRPPVAE